MTPSSAFYADRRIVVTGGAGMVGASLVAQLHARGADVLVLDDMSRGNAYIPGVPITRIDAGNEAAVRSALNGAFALFNLAAYVAGVQYNQHNHALMFERNMRLQTAPILAAAAVGVPHVLQVSSVCVYDPEHNAPSQEALGHVGEPHVANSGYAWAKRMGEYIVGWSRLAHAVIVRPSNIYGPRDYFDARAHVIPKMIRMCLEAQTEIVTRGSGLIEREFIYVDDAAAGMLAALQYGAHGAVYNVGTHGETCISMRALLEQIREATGMTHIPIRRLPAEGSEGDPRRWSDCTALHALSWRHTVSMAEGIQRTVDWYRAQRG